MSCCGALTALTDLYLTYNHLALHQATRTPRASNPAWRQSRIGAGPQGTVGKREQPGMDELEMLEEFPPSKPHNI